jgi:hypothetical protein
MSSRRPDRRRGGPASPAAARASPMSWGAGGRRHSSGRWQVPPEVGPRCCPEVIFLNQFEP